MKLEVFFKYFSFQGMYIIDDVKSIFLNCLNGIDIMIGIGVISSRVCFGLVVFFGKVGISKMDEQFVIQVLVQFVIKNVFKNVCKVVGDKFGICMLMLV